MWNVQAFGFFAVLAACGFSACVALSEAPMATDVHLSCRPDAGVSAEDSRVVCRELGAFLAETHPTLTFTPGGENLPRIDVVVTLATPGALGLSITFVDASGARRDGTPLQTAFFDRNSDPVVRRRFFTAFFQTNPLPF
jgi:hypothetical protein